MIEIVVFKMYKPATKVRINEEMTIFADKNNCL